MEKVPKRKLRNKRAADKVKFENTVNLIRAAITVGKCITKKDICEIAGITMVQLNNTLSKDRVLFAGYKILRKTIMDVATDNIVNAVIDKDHNKNYDASKFMVQNFQSDFDETLDSKDDEIKITGGDVKDPISITFSTGKK